MSTGSDASSGDQLELLRAATRGRKPRPPAAAAAELPVARVTVDVPLPHLDRVFDYLVPEPMSEAAQPGVRVRVRFGGQDIEGYLLERVGESEHPGKLAPLRKVVSPEPVLSPAVLRLCRRVAERYAGNLTDVLRLAVPPRHARVEQAPRPEPLEPLTEQPITGWEQYRAGHALLTRIAAGDAPRAVWAALPGRHWHDDLATAIEVALRHGRGSLVVLPDKRDVDALDRSLTQRLGEGRHARLEADLGPTTRYRNFLAVSRGDVKVAIGTRAAAFAPVHDLGLVAIWDDGDEMHAEPRSPYPHAREVLAVRAELEGAALIAGSWSRSVECAAWLRSGWARPVGADRAVVRDAWPRIQVAATAFGGRDDPSAHGRLPSPAWRAISDGLKQGPVLVQVPRAGYLPGLACQDCRHPARCEHCHGPLGFPARLKKDEAGLPECRWCGRVAAAWRCGSCQSRRLRATTVGVGRTAEELGQAFSGAAVVVPQADGPTPHVPVNALVVSTPGIEPPVEGGYAAAVLLDAGRLLERPDLRASEDALRRWLGAAAQVRPHGSVIIAADPQAPAVQALVRIDPGTQAERELDERTELGFPPAVVMADVTGTATAVNSLVRTARLPEGTLTLGPTEVLDASPVAAEEPKPKPQRRHIPRTQTLAGLEESRPAEPEAIDETQVRVLLRAPRQELENLARCLHEAAAIRSSRREPGATRIQLNPLNPG
ncbi:primosomal protein N' [Kineosporia succinea]|uniref:Probable replication restart protein PriA n=1 Tax=Kineosporia succinea TaxID=84632 RepID=A0ABT9NV20_9ACTN|nr:primosomal protein N' [Kineosporia succinea]MDP9824278.1 primosomal protein N' (replication factor Y) [Kineosporia succinea]